MPDVDEILRQSPPGTPPPPKASLVPGSLVFTPTKGSVDLKDFSQWWKWTPGACWNHPEGPGSNLEGMFTEMGKKDFEMSLANARAFNDKYFRTISTIAVAKNCITVKPPAPPKPKK